MPDFDKLKENAKKLVGLLEDPQPGLVSWAMLTCRTWKAIAEQWSAKTAAAPELYALLEEVTKTAGVCDELYMPHNSVLYGKINAALAKARGDA